MLKNNFYKDNYCNNVNLQIVVSYLLKILISKFTFFPSHRLVLTIYNFLCNSFMDTDELKIKDFGEFNQYIN